MRRMLSALAGVVLMGLAACGGSDSKGKPEGDAAAVETAGQTQAGGGAQSASQTSSQGSGQTGEGDGSMEIGFDRPGYDLRTVPGLASAEECRAACADDGQCRAFTWVQAGVQGPETQCWIKSDVPPQRADECCVSGVMPARVEETPAG